MGIWQRRHTGAAGLRVDCLLTEDGIGGNTVAWRQELAQRMEARRAATDGPAEWQAVRRGWCLGPAGFKADLLGSLRDGERL